MQSAILEDTLTAQEIAICLAFVKVIVIDVFTLKHNEGNQINFILLMPKILALDRNIHGRLGSL